MAIRLHSPFQDVEIRAWQELRPGDIFRPFSDVSSALHVLRGFLHDAFAMAALRDVATESLQTSTLFRYSDHDVLEQLARQLATGRLYLVPLERPRGGFHGGGPAVRPERPSEDEPVLPEDPAPVPPTDTLWITFQVVDDETGAPVAAVKLRLRLPDGTVGTYTTDADGIVHRADLPAGTCDLEKVLDDEGFEIIQFA